MNYRLVNLSTFLSAALIFSLTASGFASSSSYETTDEPESEGIDIAAGGVTCNVQSGGTVAFVARISDGGIMSARMSVENCAEAVRAAVGGAVCGATENNRDKHLIRRIEDGVPLHGTTMTIADCTLATSNATDDLVCTKTGATFGKTQISTGSPVSSGLFTRRLCLILSLLI